MAGTSRASLMIWIEEPVSDEPVAIEELISRNLLELMVSYCYEFSFLFFAFFLYSL